MLMEMYMVWYIHELDQLYEYLRHEVDKRYYRAASYNTALNSYSSEVQQKHDGEVYNDKRNGIEKRRYLAYVYLGAV